jgi:hypothetical protein
VLLDIYDRRKIRLIEGNAECRHLKKLICKGILRQVFICMWLRTPPPLHTVYVYTWYSILIHAGKGRDEGGGRVEPERRLEGQQFTKLGRKIPSIFLDDDILFWCLNS